MRLVQWLILSTVVILASCSTLNEDFSCPAPKGGSCKRMDEIYESINGIHKTQSQESMRIWVAPYQDVEGNYHPAKAIYSPVAKGESHV